MGNFPCAFQEGGVTFYQKTMPRLEAPKGNKYAVGNPGGGRPTAKETFWHRDRWEMDSKLKELEEKIASKKYAIRDMWLYQALIGNDKILQQAANKVLADLHQHGFDEDKPMRIVLDKKSQELRDKYEDELRQNITREGNSYVIRDENNIVTSVTTNSWDLPSSPSS